MFPSELELEYRLIEMQRAAEKHRLVRSLRTTPTLWERVRTRLSTRPVYTAVSQPRWDVFPQSQPAECVEGAA
jgi:hypothetical protein